MITKPIITARLVALLSFFFIASSVFSQKESMKYIGTNGKLTTLKEAIYMQKINVKSSRSTKVQAYTLNDSKWEKIGSEHYKKVNDSTWQINGSGENIPARITRTFTKQADKTWKFRDMTAGQVVKSGYAKSVKPLLLHGKVTEYYPGGNKKSISEYQNNELVSNENWEEDGTKYIDNIFYSVDSYPSYSGGIKALKDHILKGFIDAGIDVASISGSLKIGFVVMENGTIQRIKIIKGLGPSINNVAVESFATLLGPWKPAKLNGQTVRFFQVFPINFKSNESHIEFAELRGGTFHFQTY